MAVCKVKRVVCLGIRTSKKSVPLEASRKERQVAPTCRCLDTLISTFRRRTEINIVLETTGNSLGETTRRSRLPLAVVGVVLRRSGA